MTRYHSTLSPYPSRAKYPGRCCQCREAISPGDPVIIFPGNAQGSKAAHEACGKAQYRGHLAEQSMARYGNDLAYEC